jgi:RND family efflux transporter MFP subunit
MKVDIPEQDYAKIKKNMSLKKLTALLKPEIFVTSVPDRTFKAWFQEASTIADPATRTFELTMGFKAVKTVSILPGMTARLITTGVLEPDEKNIMIPAKAILSDDNGKANVWLIDRSLKIVKLNKVDAGEMSGSNIKIEKGLKTGDIIAVSGVHQLREGAKVRKYEKP